MRRGILLLFAAVTASFAAPAFHVQFSGTAHRSPVDGRLIVIVSTNTEREPRFHVGRRVDTAQIFGVDVDGLVPGKLVTVDASASGHPLRSVSALLPGRYNVQAVIN